MMPCTHPFSVVADSTCSHDVDKDQQITEASEDDPSTTVHLNATKNRFHCPFCSLLSFRKVADLLSYDLAMTTTMDMFANIFIVYIQ